MLDGVKVSIRVVNANVFQEDVKVGGGGLSHELVVCRVESSQMSSIAALPILRRCPRHFPGWEAQTRRRLEHECW